MKTAYEILDLPWNANQDEILVAYREKALLYHPDRGGDAENFLIVHRAFSLLNNYRLRALFGLNPSFPELKQMRSDFPIHATYGPRGQVIS